VAGKKWLCISYPSALLLRYLRLHGLRKLYHLGLTPAHRHAPEDWHREQVAWLQTLLGALITEPLLGLLTPEDRTQWLPWHCFDVRPGRKLHDLTLWLDGLCMQTLEDGQPIYHGRRRPTVLLQGVRLPVAFTAHALQRLQDRLATIPGSHGSLVDTFSYASHLQVFDPAHLSPDEPAVALLDRCEAGHWTGAFAEGVLGRRDLAQGYAYRLGYGPTMQADGYHVVETLLLPGYVGTPEYGAVLRASLDPGVKEQLLTQCAALTQLDKAQREDWSLWRWFHTHGVPQVVLAPPHLFLYD
jgi:hypothetical protein